MTALLAMTLAACGFQLTGLNPDTMRPYPFKSLYIDSTGPVANEVAGRLRLDPRVKLVNSANGADAMLRINGEDKIRDILTIDRSGQTEEYRFNYVVRAQLFVHGEPVGPQIIISQFRSMTYSESSILGKGQEEALLWNDMLHDAAQQLLYRMSSDQTVKAVASEAAGVPAPVKKAPDASSQP
jgi:LPS-assembly lipoprotein